jgi:hypothetical protein
LLSLCQRPVESGAADFENAGDALPVLALVQHFAGVFKLLGIELALAPEFHAALVSRHDTGTGAFGYQATFQFGEYGDHLPHRPACGRLGVDGFRQRTELYPPVLQIIEHDNQVP